MGGLNSLLREIFDTTRKIRRLSVCRPAAALLGRPPSVSRRESVGRTSLTTVPRRIRAATAPQADRVHHLLDRLHKQPWTYPVPGGLRPGTDLDQIPFVTAARSGDRTIRLRPPRLSEFLQEIILHSSSLPRICGGPLLMHRRSKTGGRRPHPWAGSSAKRC